MSKILITGANGFVGRHVLSAFARQGVDTRAALRNSGAQCGAAGDSITVGDIGPDTDWKAALREVDVVVHLAARAHVLKETSEDPLQEFRCVNVAGTVRLAEAAAANKVKRLVYVSTIGVNGNRTKEKPFTEFDEACPHDDYSQSKWEAEQALRAIGEKTGLDIVTLRPPLVYGPGNPGNLPRLMKAICSGWPLPLAMLQNRRSLVYVVNLADAIVRCAVRQNAANQTFLISDGEDISTADLIRVLAADLPGQARLWPAPVFLLQLAGSVTGKSREVNRLVESLAIDCSRIRRELDWTPPCSLREGLRLTARWYAAIHKPPLPQTGEGLG